MSKLLFASGLMVAAVTSASPGFLDESHAAVRSVVKKRDRDRRCDLEGVATFVGHQQWPEGASITALQVMRDSDGRVIVNDLEVGVLERLKGGRYKLLLKGTEFPLLLTASAPDFAGAYVVIDNCDVRVDFFLAREKAARRFE